MSTINPSPTGRALRIVGATAVVLASLLVGSLPAGAQAGGDDGPTPAFCEAWADYQDAQDGAELNTALGEMEAALTTDAPAEIAEAIVTLGTGDLDPAEVLAASDVVAAWADEPCAAATTTTTEATTTTSEATSSTTATTAPPSTVSTTATTAGDDGSAPTGGADTGAGGTATDDGPSGLAIGLAALALATGGVGAATITRRRLADRR